MAAPPLIHVDLKGQTVVVIGANTGLGLAAAKHFAKMGPARLILACRSRSKAQAALEDLAKETGYAKAEIRLIDLSDFASVASFVDELEKEGAQVDVLVANAAIAFDAADRVITADGWETQLRVNHLGTAHACLRLLPLMQKTAVANSSNPRITIVSSALHYQAVISDHLLTAPNTLRALSEKKHFHDEGGSFGRYNVTKLFNVLLARTLQSRLPPASPIVINAVDPGYCISDLRRNITFPMNYVYSFFDRLFARSSADGASTIVWAALAGTSGKPDPNLRDHLRGGYSSSWEVAEVCDFALSEKGRDFEKKIWDETVEILEKSDPKVRTAVDEYLSGK